MSPWVLHIGGTFTPTMSWSGYGMVTDSNGGRYLLYTDFRAGYLLATKEIRGSACSGFGCDNLRGTARLCTVSGTETFALTGDVHSWLRTEGARTDLSFTGGKPKPLPAGWLVAMRGTWHGPALAVASPDNSFTEVFTPRGAIRTVTSTADAGTARVTLRPGSAAAFSRACRSLAGGR
ncbi:MAG: hypothetical protein ACM3ML_11600 [Micromonosporaceae bacterium]